MASVGRANIHAEWAAQKRCGKCFPGILSGSIWLRSTQLPVSAPNCMYSGYSVPILRLLYQNKDEALDVFGPFQPLAVQSSMPICSLNCFAVLYLTVSSSLFCIPSHGEIQKYFTWLSTCQSQAGWWSWWENFSGESPILKNEFICLHPN